jgi:hypothetical protein
MKSVVLIIVSLFFLTGCTGEKKRSVNMSSHDVMEDRCIGRNLISLPRNFRESSVVTGIFRSAKLKPEDPAFEVIVRNGTSSEQEFLNEVQRRRVEITRGGSERVNVLLLDEKLPDGSVLLRLQEIKNAYISEINFVRGKGMVTVRLESYDGQYIQAEKNLMDFASEMRATDENRHGTGFCLGAVEVIGNLVAERGSYWFRDGQGSDFEIDVDTYAVDEKVSLLERMAHPTSLLNVFNVKHKVLRARERRAGGMQAEEWLGWARLSEQSDAKTLKFVLETMRSKPSKVAPGITLTFNTAKSQEDGAPTKTIISDDEAMQLWDLVVDSIRPVSTP